MLTTWVLRNHAVPMVLGTAALALGGGVYVLIRIAGVGLPLTGIPQASASLGLLTLVGYAVGWLIGVWAHRRSEPNLEPSWEGAHPLLDLSGSERYRRRLCNEHLSPAEASRRYAQYLRRQQGAWLWAAALSFPGLLLIALAPMPLRLAFPGAAWAPGLVVWFAPVGYAVGFARAVLGSAHPSRSAATLVSSTPIEGDP